MVSIETDLGIKDRFAQELESTVGWIFRGVKITHSTLLYFQVGSPSKSISKSRLSQFENCDTLLKSSSWWSPLLCLDLSSLLKIEYIFDILTLLFQSVKLWSTVSENQSKSLILIFILKMSTATQLQKSKTTRPF